MGLSSHTVVGACAGWTGDGSDGIAPASKEALRPCLSSWPRRSLRLAPLSAALFAPSLFSCEARCSCAPPASAGLCQLHSPLLPMVATLQHKSMFTT